MDEREDASLVSFCISSLSASTMFISHNHLQACWSGDGNQIYAGRRNGTVDVWDVRQYGSSSKTARLLKTLKNPGSSGVVSCVAALPDGRHIARCVYLLSLDNAGPHETIFSAPLLIICAYGTSRMQAKPMGLGNLRAVCSSRSSQVITADMFLKSVRIS